jgi:hypothetical protein
MTDRLGALAEAIRADLRAKGDDEDEALVAARRRIAAEYQALRPEERTKLHAMLQGAPSEEPRVEASRDTQELMAELKRRGPRPAPVVRAPLPSRTRREAATIVQVDPLNWDEWTPTRPSRRIAFRHHAFEPLGPPDLPHVANWCQRCGREAGAHLPAKATA